MKFLKVIGEYYRTQAFIDIGWGEVSWWDSSLINLMAYLYILEKIGIVIVGPSVAYILIWAFVFFYFLGRVLKRYGLYDKAQFVEAELDPVMSKLLQAADIIIENDKKEKEG